MDHSIDRYVEEWEKIVWRMGQWIDYKNEYRPMDLIFMESVVGLCEAFEKGLVYKGFKVFIFMNWLMKLVCYYYMFFFQWIG